MVHPSAVQCPATIATTAAAVELRKAMTPNFIAAITALCCFLASVGLGSLNENNPMAGVWIFTLLSATMYGVSLCFLIAKNNPEYIWIVGKSIVLPMATCATLMLMHQPGQAMHLDGWQWIVFCAIPLLNWATNITLVYECLLKHDCLESMENTRFG